MRFVYFIRCDTAIKIGVSFYPEFRLKQLQRCNPNHELVLLREVPGGLQLERLYHKLFAHLRIRGEWYQAAPELVQFIDDLPELEEVAA